ncbi:MAG: hypothetical protein AAGG46_05510, partial [Planctomycetota bacterium]
NHSLEAAAVIGAELEQLFQVWRQLFAGYYLGDAEVRARFVGTRTARLRSRPFNVFYHRTREGYIAHLRNKQPRIEITEGIYFDDLREAHFFANEEGGVGSEEEVSLARPALRLPPSAFHEAVHQLFQESKGARRGVGGRDNFWALEGVACYFESLTPLGDGRYAIGGVDAGRLPNARHRLLVDDYLVPLEAMASLGMRDLQRRSDLPRFYGQSAAVATFLMHAGAPAKAGGTRREAFVRYLSDLYGGRSQPDSLVRVLGEPWADLERSYRRWMADPTLPPTPGPMPPTPPR